MEDIWKDITGYEGIYQISNLGKIKSLSRLVWGGEKVKYYYLKEIILKQSLGNWGYYTIDLRKNTKCKKYLVHRLIAFEFILNPDNKPEINHINGIKTDNRIENLEWVTHRENIIHAFKTGLCLTNGMTGKFGKLHHNSRKIYQYDLNGNYINTFDSLHDVNRILGLNISHLCNCALGKRKTTGGYKWSYLKLIE